eukprot:TRINITY_DN111_c0_g1_i4.p1 TRINITY_DN111_c0_g1~~TRINITY_DN111_c0_g1_i4.p1  ORF type:complete len:508 (+),score=164.80 TRINITY_DN111_c0_g1_i4:50-1525(+)
MAQPQSKRLDHRRPSEDDIYPALPSETKQAPSAVDIEVLKSIGMSDNEILAFERQRSAYINKDQIMMSDIKMPPEEFFTQYSDLPKADTLSPDAVKHMLSKLAVIKLNGGLGTGMGCSGGKGTIEVRAGMTFLDLTVQHIAQLNSTYGVNVPLVLMNSFRTDKETNKVLEKYKGQNVRISTFIQSKFPRVYRDTMNPVPKPGSKFNVNEWYPPGSGDVFRSIMWSGLLDSLVAEGKEYIFVSNVENIGAVVDLAILSQVVQRNTSFALEVTDRISTDVTGGLLALYRGKPTLVEMSQVKVEKIRDFREFRSWNTNNLWANLKTVRTLSESDALDLDWVASRTGPEGRHLQIETPAGMAIRNFPGAVAIQVPRLRFRPVKSTSQLMLAQSNLFTFKDGIMTMNPTREIGDVPLIKLGEEFHKLGDYEKRIKSIPDIIELDHLTVSGDVVFGQGVKLKGTVIIVAEHGEHIDIPDGVVLENKILSGNLRVLEH